ncbi:MAG: hypothetical protein NTV80_21245 [Verrucomicrobia bacterium]|nr:hypothetical protein [Verrucomicrobiota bacterium]
MKILRILIIAQMLLPWASVMSAGVADSSSGRPIRVVDDWHDPHLLAHEQQVNIFLGSSGLGIYRTLPPAVPGMHGTLGFAQRAVHLRDGSETQPIYHDLVGIAASPNPRVYCVIQAKLKEQLSIGVDVERAEVVKASLLPFDGTEKRGETVVSHRKLDWFEQTALAQLRLGHAYCSTEEGGLWRGMGAIRAQASCLRCHDEAKEGDLLGAFTYAFTVEKKPEPNPGTKIFKSTFSEGIDDKTHWERYRAKIGYAKPRADKPYPADLYVKMVDHLWQGCGIVRDTHIQHVKDERADLERAHMANTAKPKLYGWPPTATQKVKSLQKQ